MNVRVAYEHFIPQDTSVYQEDLMISIAKYWKINNGFANIAKLLIF